MAFNITPDTVLSGIQQVGNLLIKTSRVDVIQVINQETLLQIFSGARPMKAGVRETLRVMNYPVETGAILSDHKINNPTEITLDTIIPASEYASAYPQVRNAALNATLLSVQTRLGTYRNMIISDYPHEEEPDMFTAVAMTIKLQEVIFAAPTSIAAQGQLANYAPANPENTAVANSGLIGALVTPATILGYLHAGSVWGISL